jgi:RNA polymerase sigma factor (sigma-70 family)
MERSREQVWQDTLVLRAQDGDAPSLELLAGIWYRKHLVLALRLTGSRQMALEACQEGWLAISRSISRLDDPARFAAWARRIIANKSVDLIRRAGRQRKHEADAGQVEGIAATDQPDTQCGTDDVSRIRAALRQMPGNMRLVLSLYYTDGLSISAIAGLLQIPHGTVKSRLFHARAELKELVNGEENGRH